MSALRCRLSTRAGLLEFFIPTNLCGRHAHFFGEVGDFDAKLFLQPLDTREVIVNGFQSTCR